MTPSFSFWAWKCGCQGTTIDSSTFESTHVFSAFPGRCPVIASISSSRNRVFVVIVKLIHSLCERSPKNLSGWPSSGNRSAPCFQSAALGA